MEETTQREIVMTRICSCMFSVAGLAICGATLAEPVSLQQSELDAVTAAGHSGMTSPAPNGGAIVGNGSAAVLESTGSVTIGDGSQVDARALNLVNASESTIANGVNVFNGSAAEQAEFDNLTYDVEQLNAVTQDQRRLSSLPAYERGANTETSTMESGSSEYMSSSSVFDQVIDLERTFILDEATTDGGFDRSSAPTFSINVDGLFQLGEDGKILKLDVDQYDIQFNAPSASNSVGVVFNGQLNYGVDGGTINVDTGDLGLTVTVEMPEVDFNFDAMGCVAVNGSCTIEGTRTESSEEVSDHSTLYTSEESGSGSSEWSSIASESVQAPFTLEDAQAEYIVVDESTIDVISSYVVNLSGGAQANLRAMNVVNAAGSAVANGVNVAVMEAGVISSASPVFTLSQRNMIDHSR